LGRTQIGGDRIFVGHLAVALGSKKLTPEVPVGAAVAAAFGLDLVWPVFLLLGIETVQVNPGSTAFTNLSFVSYPWSHSLATSIAWAGLASVLGRFVYRSWRVGTLLGGLVVSHWLLDFITHRPDLPLWPGGPLYGLSLWNSIVATILVEGGLFLTATWLYLRETEATDRIGSWSLFALLALVALIWITQPWSPLPPSSAAVAWGALILWWLPPWAAWIERHRVIAGAA
jgi:hypothetical protein